MGEQTHDRFVRITGRDPDVLTCDSW